MPRFFILHSINGVITRDCTKIIIGPAQHAQGFSIALSDDIKSVFLVRECLELEEHFETNFTQLLLTTNSESNEESRPSSRQIRDLISNQDKQLLLDKCSNNDTYNERS